MTCTVKICTIMEYRERDIKPRYIGVDNVVVSISGAVRLEYSWSETAQKECMICLPVAGKY